jgi:hypothetical protein
VKPAAFALLFGLFLSTPSALADQESVSLDFRASAGCPNREQFISRVRARTERVRFVDAGSANASGLHVQADYEGDRAVGRLRLGDGREAERLVTGKTCPDVISALALIAAVAIDPTAISDPSESVAAIAPSASIPEPESQARGVEAQAPPSPETPAAGPASHAPLPWFGGAGARGEISRGFGPRTITLAGASVFGEVGLDLGGSWRSAARLAALLEQSPTVVPDQMPDSAAATFTLLAGRLSICPVEFSPRPSFRVRPCAELELGQLTGKGRPVANGAVTSLHSGTMTRVAVGQTLQGRIRLASRVWLELEMALREPLLRQNFVFHDPDVTVTSAPVVELGGALGLGLLFP